MDQEEKAVMEAEKAIQKILLDLEQNWRPVESVDVDTRRFGNCGVSIFLQGRKS